MPPGWWPWFSGSGVASWNSAIFRSLVPQKAKSKLDEPTWSPAACEIAPGWAIRSIHRVPEKINRLIVSPRRGLNPGGEVYVGTVHAGGVYRVNPLTPDVLMTVSRNLDEINEFGDCWVNRLAVRDLDGDHYPEVGFGSKSGMLWRYDLRRTLAITRILKAPPPLRPIATEGDPNFAGWSHDILKRD